MSEEKKVRLLACSVCRTIDEIGPMFDGPPEHDSVLERVASKHQSAGVRHKGQLFVVDAETWSKPLARAEIQKKITESLDGGESGLGSAAYALMETLKDDAMDCFKAHRRNPACPDYKSDKMRIAPGTAQERRAAGMDPRYDAGGPSLTRYLCEWCPVHSLVQQASRQRAGLYE